MTLSAPARRLGRAGTFCQPLWTTRVKLHKSAAGAGQMAETQTALPSPNGHMLWPRFCAREALNPSLREWLLGRAAGCPHHQHSEADQIGSSTHTPPAPAPRCQGCPQRLTCRAGSKPSPASPGLQCKRRSHKGPLCLVNSRATQGRLSLIYLFKYGPADSSRRQSPRAEMGSSQHTKEGCLKGTAPSLPARGG